MGWGHSPHLETEVWKCNRGNKMNQDIQTIAFQGNQIMTAQQGDVNYVAMKSVCESIGLNWRSQYNRIKRHAFLGSTVVIMTTVAEDGKEREMLMLPLNYFQGWLFTVDSNRVKLEIRDRLIAYQKECFDVLHDYWQNKSVQFNLRRRVLQQPLVSVNFMYFWK